MATALWCPNEAAMTIGIMPPSREPPPPPEVQALLDALRTGAELLQPWERGVLAGALRMLANDLAPRRRWLDEIIQFGRGDAPEVLDLVAQAAVLLADVTGLHRKPRREFIARILAWQQEELVQRDRRLDLVHALLDERDALREELMQLRAGRTPTCDAT